MVSDYYLHGTDIALVVWWLVCLPLDPKVAGSNPAKAMDF
jgi:hypothetical protein